MHKREEDSRECRIVYPFLYSALVFAGLGKSLFCKYPPSATLMSKRKFQSFDHLIV
ncbi:hypothetical protein BDV34DRAFT_201470 [Aspergillus parasiticus]|uniref:Uncharacterized protein n=1 Tax=Aspergillus parasiticus TaxID=5067 RepID=A0A5N6DDI7_ASPPA|nr:hypothetical protein BDV34DRAFT_201470 [Aspergillus parasiticus]